MSPWALWSILAPTGYDLLGLQTRDGTRARTIFGSLAVSFLSRNR